MSAVVERATDGVGCVVPEHPVVPVPVRVGKKEREQGVDFYMDSPSVRRDEGPADRGLAGARRAG